MVRNPGRRCACPGLLSHRPYRTSVWLAPLAYRRTFSSVCDCRFVYHKPEYRLSPGPGASRPCPPERRFPNRLSAALRQERPRMLSVDPLKPVWKPALRKERWQYQAPSRTGFVLHPLPGCSPIAPSQSMKTRNLNERSRLPIVPVLVVVIVIVIGSRFSIKKRTTTRTTTRTTRRKAATLAFRGVRSILAMTKADSARCRMREDPQINNKTCPMAIKKRP